MLLTDYNELEVHTIIFQIFDGPTNAQRNKTIDEAGKRMSQRVNADLQQKIDAKLSAQIQDKLDNLPGN
jgi:hypothetical protein